MYLNNTKLSETGGKIIYRPSFADNKRKMFVGCLNFALRVNIRRAGQAFERLQSKKKLLPSRNAQLA